MDDTFDYIIDLPNPFRAPAAKPDKNTWATPLDLFADLHAEFGFTVDACALPWNAKLPRYFSPEQNGLAQPWDGERVWCNPPYGKGLILPWVEKALASAATTVFLLPSRTGTEWFQRLYKAPNVEIRFLPKRVKFLPPAGVTASSPMEDNIVVVVN